MKYHGQGFPFRETLFLGLSTENVENFRKKVENRGENDDKMCIEKELNLWNGIFCSF